MANTGHSTILLSIEECKFNTPDSRYWWTSKPHSMIHSQSNGVRGKIQGNLLSCRFLFTGWAVS